MDKIETLHAKFVRDMAISVSQELASVIANDGLTDKDRILDLIEELVALI